MKLFEHKDYRLQLAMISYVQLNQYIMADI